MYEDQPPFGADDKCKAAHFGRHPLGRSVLGTVAEHRRPAGRGHARLFRPPLFSPGNIVLVGGGRIDFDDAGRPRPKRSAAAGSRIAAAREISPADAAAGLRGDRQGHRPRRSIVLQLADGPFGRPTTIATPPSAGHDPRRRLGQPAVLGPGRSAAWPNMPACTITTIMGTGAVHDLSELRPRVRRRQLAADRSRSIAKPRRTASPPPSWPRPRARSTRASCWAASGRAAGCSPSGQIGRSAASIAPWPTISTAIEAVTLDDVAAVLARYPLSRSTSVAIGPLDTLPPPN